MATRHDDWSMSKERVEEATSLLRRKAREEMAIAMKRVEKFAESHLGKLTED